MTDPTGIIATAVSTIGILVGVYSIVNRSEDRINRRMDERFAAMDRHFEMMERLFTEKWSR